MVVVKAKKDVARFHRLLRAEHGLGDRPPAGDTLRQAVVRSDGEWVALLLWGSAAYRLKARDAYVGWDAAKRASRLKLVAQNSRFLVVESTREPNLASRALAAALRALPAQWREEHGYAPVLAETFTDPEAHRGTCVSVRRNTSTDIATAEASCLAKGRTGHGTGKGGGRARSAA